jgi:uncharacterized membrane protein (UPF0127 family)
MSKIFSGAKIFFIIIALLILLGVVSALEKTSPSLPSASQDTFSYATTTISMPNGNIIAQIADTVDKETQGLSGRTDLPQGMGMLFVFDAPSPQYMWMKDMNIPLDMVWLDENKKVVHVAAGVTPETYLQNPPGIFYSPIPALYVIEIPSGDANRLGIIVGKTLSFTSSR